jgi:hypothetical protein
MEFIELVLLILSSGFRSFSMVFSNGIHHFFPTYLDIAGVVFQVNFNCKYGKHINTCEITFLICVPIATVLLSFICSKQWFGLFIID